jgi:hypothetical protein
MPKKILPPTLFKNAIMVFLSDYKAKLSKGKVKFLYSIVWDSEKGKHSFL